MHFSKTYSQLLLTLPQELKENAIEYRQLKKLINQVVSELVSLGLSPSVLQTLLQAEEHVNQGNNKGKQRDPGERPGDFFNYGIGPPATKAIYEVINNGDHLQPRLRLWVGELKRDREAVLEIDDRLQRASPPTHLNVYLNAPDFPSSPVNATMFNLPLDMYKKDMLFVTKPIVALPGQSLIWTVQRKTEPAFLETDASEPIAEDGVDGDDHQLPVLHPVELVRKQTRMSPNGTRELIVPLASDTAFFELLYTALQSLSSHLLVVRSNFINNLETLARSISRTARPQSALPGGFHPLSSFSDPQSVTAPLISPFSASFVPGGKSKSDLYSWREIFQLYVEMEIFESLHERDRGERDITETERRLALFAEQVTTRGLNDRRKLGFKDSRDALEKFLQLNVLLVNLKKFQFANAEAARKILKKHAKRTALPFPIPRLDSSSVTLEIDSQVFPLIHKDQGGSSHANILTLIPTSATSLPHLLVQAIGETLLPVIPHLDDYSCLICTSIAFKPIRLDCKHLFCVRCLVKMQKRGQDHCPCCRAPTVLKADRTNVDWAMLNFMQDWFPRESAQKLKQNEKEAAQEQLEELGIHDRGCVVM